MTEEEFNDAISLLLYNKEPSIHFGLFWNDIHFDDPITLGLRPSDQEVRIMQKDKWGWREYVCNETEHRALLAMLLDFAQNADDQKLKSIYDHLQTFKDRLLASRKRWGEDDA